MLEGPNVILRLLTESRARHESLLPSAAFDQGVDRHSAGGSAYSAACSGRPQAS